MCGRYTLHSRLNLLLQQFAVETAPAYHPRYNIAPTQDAPVVRQRTPKAQRSMDLLRWGLIPLWADDPSIGNRMINARAETAHERPAFRAAFRRRRCLVPADGYYEWQKAATHKQPFYIRVDGGKPFAMAGLWEHWEDDGGNALETYTVLTTDANEATRHLHDRMPVILDKTQYARWLDPHYQEVTSLRKMLRPFPSERVDYYPVSTYVNSPQHEGPQCIKPIQREH